VPRHAVIVSLLTDLGPFGNIQQSY